MADDAQDDQNSEPYDRCEPIDRLSSTTMKVVECLKIIML